MLKTVVHGRRDYIFEELLKRIELLPQSRYRDFARTDEGHKRVRIWIDKIIQGIAGQPEIFLSDAEKVGYMRAHQGYKLGFIFNFYRIFKQIVWELVEPEIQDPGNPEGGIIREFNALNDILFQGLDKVTASYLKTREEIIAEKISQLQTLTGTIMEIQEEERRNLAGAIHDTITQSLTGIGYKIQICQDKIQNDPGGLSEHLDQLLDTVYGTIDQSREMISNLRPDLIDTLGLVAALKKHLHHFEMETGIRIRYRLNENLSLPPQVKICLFRAVQEALMNIYKHANTDVAEISLGVAEDQIRLEISDKGTGFNPQLPATGSGIGLLMMRERIEAAGGILTVQSRPGEGTQLIVIIPVKRGGK